MLLFIVIAVVVFIASRPDSQGEADAALAGALKGAIPKAGEQRGLNDPAAPPKVPTRGLNDPAPHEEAKERYELKIPDPEPEPVVMKGRA